MKLRHLFIPVLAFFSCFVVSCSKPHLEEGPNKPNIEENKPTPDIKPDGEVIDSIEYEKIDDNYINNKVGYTMKIIGKSERKINDTFDDEGLTKYPTYNNNMEFTDNEKDLILKENDCLRASEYNYNRMDSLGNLYLNDKDLKRKLYRHSASENNYLGEVSVNESAVLKKITIYPDKLGSYVTGLYAPAGEVIKITISSEDLEYLNYVNEKYNITDSSGKRFPALKAIIGQKQERETKENNIWPARNFVRMPLLANTMNVNSTTTYVGSYLGGPIYIDLGNKVDIKPVDRKPITIMIDGAVEYHHYIHGLTTLDDYLRTSNSTAPFFELAVTDNIVRFSGPKAYATNVDGSKFTYNDAYECAKLWTKIARTSHRVPVNSTTNGSISFLFEPFVAAGAAVAFPHYNWVNAPLSWFPAALDSHNFRNNGAWGDIHEFNHHHQNYGTGTLNDRLEVSNNATSLLSYVSHTNISSRRKKGVTGVMGDYWNEFLNPEYSLKDTLSRINNGTNYSLSGYADLIHAFGVETFINITNTQYQYTLGELQNNDDRWYYATTIATGYDMTYYMKDILKLNINDNIINVVKKLEYPTYVPAAIAYQTGYGIKSKGKIVYSDTTLPYVLNSGDEEIIDLEKDLVLPSGFNIVEATTTKPTYGSIEKMNNYKFKYSFKTGNNDEFILNVKVKNDLLKIETTLSFKLEFAVDNKQVIVRDYEYDSSDYNSKTNSNFLDKEFKNDFSKAKNKVTSFDIDAKVDNIRKHHIVESVGKIYIPRTETYQFGLKTDKTSYLYISTDNVNYELKAYTDTWTLGSFDSTGTLGFTMDLKKGDYVYYKLVTGMPHNDNGYGEIGWGIKVDPNKNPILNSIDERYVMNVHQTYEANVYKDFPLEDIITPYEYYIDNSRLNGFNINDDSCYLDNKDTFGIMNIFDNNLSTRYHSKNHVSPSKPIEFSVDLGSVNTFNTVEFTRYGTALEAPSDFEVYIGNTTNDINTKVAEFRSLKINGFNLEAKFNKEITTRYVRFVVKKTTSNRFFVCSDILFKNLGEDLYIHPSSPNMEYEKNKYKDNFNILGTFGKTIDITDGHFKFDFTGTGFVINSSHINNNLKLIIKIDDNKEITINSFKSKDLFKINDLINGKHSVTVKVVGKLNLNAVKYYR